MKYFNEPCVATLGYVGSGYAKTCHVVEKSSDAKREIFLYDMMVVLAL